jgi:hypothetical protein
VRCTSIIGEENQFLSHDDVCFGINDADICSACMGSTNFDLYWEDLIWCEGLDVCAVVGELVALANGKVACCGTEIFLREANLKFCLNISLVVGSLVIKDFQT